MITPVRLFPYGGRCWRRSSDLIRRSDFSDLLEVPEEFTDNQLRDAHNEVVRRLRPGGAMLSLVAALLCLGLQGGIVVETAVKGNLPNTSNVVTSVRWEGVEPGFVNTNAVLSLVDSAFTGGTSSVNSVVTSFEAVSNAAFRVDGAARPLPKYLWKVDFSDSYESDAYWYYSREDAAFSARVPGLCSARRDGNVLERNYDWYRDHAAEFVVLEDAGPGRFASVGVANIGENLTEEFVSSGKWSKYYKCLPGRTVDGVNEKGVAIEVNVVVTNGSPWETHTEGDGRDIDSRWAVRWVLDNAPNAEWAASNLADRVYVSKALMRKGYSVHYAIVDRDGTWLVEDGKAIMRPSSWPLVMTNFRLDTQPSRIRENDPYGAGYERWEMLSDYSVSITDAWYSNAYRRNADGDFPWPTEFAGSVDDLGPITNVETNRLQAWAKANIPASVPDAAFPRGAGLWQTVHTSVYDISNLTLRVAVQEQDDWYAFSVPVSAGVKPEAVMEIVTNETSRSVSERLDSDRIRIGSGADAMKATAISIGGNSQAREVRSVAIGQNAYASRERTIAIGSIASASHDDSIAIGPQATSHGSGTFNVKSEIGSWYAGDAPVIQSLLTTGYVPSNVVEVVTNPPSPALRAPNGPTVVTNEYVVYVPDPDAPTLLRHGEETASDLRAALDDVLTNDVADCQCARSNLVKVVEGGLTGLVEAVASPKYRPFGDEFVYEPGEMSDFQWSCQSKPGLAAALGTIQPQHCYDYGGDYREWELEFTYDGMDWHVTAYNTYNSPLVTFSGWGWAYDYDTDEYREDYVDDLEGRRTAGEYHRRDPVETFAHNSQIQPIYTEMTQIRNLVSGDDLKQRSGGLGEYGYGPGYVSRDIRSERRNWRIRVPKWTSIQNMTTNNIQSSSTFYLTESTGSKSVTFRIPEASYNQYASAVLSNPLSWLPNWDMRHRLVETRGVYGSDCCRMADYKIGLFLAAPGLSDKCAVKFKAVQTAYSPMSFSVTPDYTGLSVVSIYNPDSTTSRCLCSEALVDAPPFTTRWAQTVSGVQITNETTCTITGIAVRGTEASPSVVQSTSGQIALNLYHISDRTFKVYRADTGSVLANFTQTGVIGKFTVTINCNSNAQFMDYVAPFYKVLTSQDGNFYYDAAGDSSYRVDVSNGCFYAEKFMDGDWRKAATGDDDL